jgi:minimal PKS acyl carrier protein
MTEFTREDLKHTMEAAAGVDESVDLDGDILDVTFTDLGYDSLAMMETAGLVERKFDLVLPEDDVMAAETPRQFVALVNRQISASTV